MWKKHIWAYASASDRSDQRRDTLLRREHPDVWAAEDEADAQKYADHLSRPVCQCEIIAEYILIHHTYPTRREIFNRAAQLMDIVGLARRTANSYPHELDGGRRQRIGIARALSLNPQFIVCDEPVSALDVSIQAQILNLLMDLQSEMDLTYMFVTHDLSVVRHISDHIMVMYLGESLEYAEADELFNSPLHPYTRALLSSIPEPDISMRNKKISVIKGEVVSPINPKPGCRFAPRCENCMEICTQCSPELKEVAPGHLVACHKYA